VNKSALILAIGVINVLPTFAKSNLDAIWYADWRRWRDEEFSMPGARWIKVDTEAVPPKIDVMWETGRIESAKDVQINPHDGTTLLFKIPVYYWFMTTSGRYHKYLGDYHSYLQINNDNPDEATLTCRAFGPKGEHSDTPADFQKVFCKRAKPMPPAPDVNALTFGNPIPLFDGETLSGWRLVERKKTFGLTGFPASWIISETTSNSGWSAKDGVLVNAPKLGDIKPEDDDGWDVFELPQFGNLRTEREFEDFRLTLEVRLPQGGNSGIFLRGRYEVEVADSFGTTPSKDTIGAIYSRIAPTVNAARPAGEWQTFDITFADRHVTVLLNGQKVIDNQPVEGCTSGAIDSDDTKPGPIYLQGDHTAVEYRNITLYPRVQQMDAREQTTTAGDYVYTYSVKDGGASIGSDQSLGRAVSHIKTGFTPVGKLIIPATLGGYPVTSIGDAAFMDCGRLTHVTIPQGVTSIGKDAFLRCGRLTGVTIPASVTTIGENAFLNCTNLTDVTLPNGVRSVGKYAFQNCANLTNLAIPASITLIGDGAFQGCRGLRDVAIPSSIKTIGDNAFAGSGLAHVTIHKDVSMGSGVFAGSGLASVAVSEGVTSIGNNMFTGCHGLTTVAIPSSVTSIGNGTFAESGLTSMVLPSNITSIGDWAFHKCNDLRGVALPSRLTSIGEGLFSGCRSLTNVTVPEGVTSIGVHAFWGCSSLTNVTIASSVTSIGRSAFQHCANLTSVVIPKNIISIGIGAFYDCKSLTSVTIPRDTVIEPNSFPKTCTIHRKAEEAQ